MASASTEIDPGKSGEWSIEDAGFISVDVFNRRDKASTIDRLTDLLGTLPDSPVTKQDSSKRDVPSTRIEIATWTLDGVAIERIFTEPAKEFQIELGPLLPLYRSLQVFLIDNPTVPYLLLAIRGAIFHEKLDPVSTKEPIRDQLRKLSLPIRLFIEKIPGLSSENVSWSPHAANVTWVGVKVEAVRLAQLRQALALVQDSTLSPSLAKSQRESIFQEVKRLQPFDLADTVVNITSHTAPYDNVHVIVSHADQPGVAMYRTLSVTYLSTESSLFGTLPEMRIIFLPQFPRRVDWAPSFFETALVWLLSLNIWANSRLAVAANLDQAAMAFRRSPNIDSAPHEIGKVLSDVSVVGTEAAVASGEVSLTKRRTSSFLDEFTAPNPFRHEINVSKIPYFLADFVKSGETGVVSSLASMTRESLESADQQLREIEGEVAAFQRHLSDIATLQSQDTSSRLSAQVQRLTKWLVILTRALVFSAVLQVVIQFVIPLLK